MKKYYRVLTIAGSDPSGGAGVQADIKTISAMGCYAASAITSVVNENTVGVYGVHDIPVEFVVGQIESVMDDIGVDAVKIGMLHSAELAHAVAELLKEREVKNVVLDPVMVATSGDELMRNEAVDVLRTELIPQARIITPNVPEAERLLGGRQIKTLEEMKDAASELTDLGTSVLLKGGHMNFVELFKDNKNVDPNVMIDILCNSETMQQLEIPSDRVETRNTHGTGCTLSSAIASSLAKGKGLTSAVLEAKTYMAEAIKFGAEYEIGKGHGPVCHFFKILE